MSAHLHPLTSLAASLLVGGLLFLVARTMLGRFVRRLAWAWLAVTVLAHLAWRLSPFGSLSFLGESISTALFVVICFASLGLAPAIVVRGVPHAGRLLGWVARRLWGLRATGARPARAPSVAPPVQAEVAPQPAASSPPPAPRPTRRAFVTGALASFPAATASLGVAGIARANRGPLEPGRVIGLPRLPRELEGLRILQISDVHLGFERNVRDIDAFVERVLARSERPDLLLLTGDIADDVGQLYPALSALSALAPRLGTFACMGNHEHFYDPRAVRRAYERAGIPLLVDDGARVAAPGGDLFLAGVDDPIVTHGLYGLPNRATEAFYDGGVTRALSGSRDGDLKILLSHRPDGFVLGARAGVDLTLSGHTHGGHIGFTDRSLVERFAPGMPLWGSYARGASRLYVTSGFGHWFRFRLGCPAEAPWVELRREVEPLEKSAARVG